MRAARLLKRQQRERGTATAEKKIGWRRRRLAARVASPARRAVAGAVESKPRTTSAEVGSGGDRTSGSAAAVRGAMAATWTPARAGWRQRRGFSDAGAGSFSSADDAEGRTTARGDARHGAATRGGAGEAAAATR
ncbi:hypothetical protein Syun_024202 [Stephania yunnanensis]|uniref:Uncharacterized protein n=1 Tax=Stephania yunnanensis TaxID=152371 RepID=A0AAP0FBG3_9MAGN